MNDLITNFIEKDIAINLRTHEAFFEFMKLCEERGLKWNDGADPTLYDYWADEEFCVVYDVQRNSGMRWADEKSYVNNGYKIFKIESL